MPATHQCSYMHVGRGEGRLRPLPQILAPPLLLAPPNFWSHVLLAPPDFQTLQHAWADCTHSNFDDTEMGKWTELHSCCNYFLLNRHFSLLNDFKVPQKNHSFLWLNISCHCDKFLIDMTHWLPSKLCIHSFFLVSKSKNKCFLLFASVASKESQRNHVTKSNELVCLLGVNGRKATCLS